MEAAGVNESSLSRLRRRNLGLSFLHSAQVVAVLLLANGFAITVTSQFPSGPPGKLDKHQARLLVADYLAG